MAANVMRFNCRCTAAVYMLKITSLCLPGRHISTVFDMDNVSRLVKLITAAALTGKADIIAASTVTADMAAVLCFLCCHISAAFDGMVVDTALYLLIAFSRVFVGTVYSVCPAADGRIMGCVVLAKPVFIRGECACRHK